MFGFRPVPPTVTAQSRLDMRHLLNVLLLYLLFLIQAAAAPVAPDLVLVVLLVLALHEERVVVTALGLFAGICLDLLTPASTGINAFAYAGVAYGAAALRNVIYRGRGYLLALVAAGELLIIVGRIVAGAGSPSFWMLIMSFGLTLLLTIPLERLLGRIYHRQWDHASDV